MHALCKQKAKRVEPQPKVRGKFKSYIDKKYFPKGYTNYYRLRKRTSEVMLKDQVPNKEELLKDYEPSLVYEEDP